MVEENIYIYYTGELLFLKKLSGFLMMGEGKNRKRMYGKVILI